MRRRNSNNNSVTNKKRNLLLKRRRKQISLLLHKTSSKISSWSTHLWLVWDRIQWWWECLVLCNWTKMPIQLHLRRRSNTSCNKWPSTSSWLSISKLPICKFPCSNRWWIKVDQLHPLPPKVPISSIRNQVMLQWCHLLIWWVWCKLKIWVLMQDFLKTSNNSCNFSHSSQWCTQDKLQDRTSNSKTIRVKRMNNELSRLQFAAKYWIGIKFQVI